MQVVGILGGMGPAAGADFVRLFVQSCAEHMHAAGIVVTDQRFPEHWLAQVPVPDRSAALQHTGHGAHQPLEPMLQALGRLAALGARTVAIPCNTAHAWHSRLQAGFPQIELLHIAQETARHLARQGVRGAALMATLGTYRSGVYETALREAGIACHLPTLAECDRIMHGIYDGVKTGNMALARQCTNATAVPHCCWAAPRFRWRWRAPPKPAPSPSPCTTRPRCWHARSHSGPTRPRNRWPARRNVRPDSKKIGR
jgi:aspartate racemase